MNVNRVLVFKYLDAGKQDPNNKQKILLQSLFLK